MRRAPGAVGRTGERESDPECHAREQGDEKDRDAPRRPRHRAAPTPYRRANPAISSSFSASDVFVAFSPSVHGGLR